MQPTLILLMSLIQPLWLPPIATRGSHHRSTNRFFRTSFPMTPCLRLITCTGTDYYPGYLARAFHSLVAKSCFATANISERFSLVWLPVYYLDWLFSSDRLLPALLTSPAYWLFSLSAACLDPLLCLRLCICLVYVALDTAVWSLPVWLLLCVNKAANGSQRHWPLITIKLI